MNRLSKAYQLRPKVSEPKAEKPRAFNSTLAAPSKPMNKISKKGRATRLMDSVCADEVMSRDGFACVACRVLERREVPATVVHHILRKNTHHGVDRRFRLGYQISLCDMHHRDAHAQNGYSRELSVFVAEQHGDRFVLSLSQEARNGQYEVTDWNPFDTED